MVEQLENLSKEHLISEVINHHSKVVEKESEIVQLKHQINLLQKALFGQKKEVHKAIVSPDQVRLEFGEKVDLDLAQDIELLKITYHRKKAPKKREDFSKLALPDDLPREVVVIEPQDKTDDMVRIGEEVTELLAITPQRFYVKKIVRPKYARANKEGVVVAELPSRPIQGGMVDVSLLTMILLDKYVDHLPIYRQLKKYERLGVKLCDSTVGNWAAESIKLLEYLYQELKIRILQSHYLQADETPIQVLDKLKKGTTHRGYYWVYHDPGTGLVLYEYDESRSKKAPTVLLKEYTGYLQTDGYAVYDALPNKDIVLVGCMAHARRKFYEAQDNNKEKATWMLDKIQQLYTVETAARAEKLNHEERLKLRARLSQPVLDEIIKWLKDNIMEVTPKSPIGKAMEYMLARIDKLCIYATDGSLEIDNNLVENAIRPIALGRKNYLFAGSHEAAKRAGIIYSFITCCKKNGYDPYVWLEETLTKLPDTKKSDLYKLLPIIKQDGV